MGLITILAVTLLSFLIIELPPGDFVDTYIANLAGAGSAVSAETAQGLRDLYGLDQPFLVRYVKWMDRMVHGDFGESMEWGRPVAELIGDRLLMTMIISILAIVVTWGLALPIGIYSAVRRYSLGDYVITFIGFIGLAIPNFLLALILMYLGFKYFNMSVGGLFSAEFEQAAWNFAKLGDLMKHLPLPVLVLALGGTAQLVRIMRANLLDELNKPYVVTARAKGLSRMRTIVKYPVRAALNPFASTLAYLFPYVVSGSVIVSLVLSLPTVGPLLLRALISQDLFLAGTIVLLLGTMTVIGTVFSDLVLMWIDPRIRLEGQL